MSQLLADALEQPAESRAVWLDAACRGNETLRTEVASLLDASERAGTFLESSAVASVDAAEVVASAARRALGLAAGRTIGAYRIVRELGRGGMGVVYLGERADAAFDRQVAIKVIRGGLAGEHELRRFDAERRILATLDHPNIARLLDGGVDDDGLSYFVMEFVDGEPFDTYCDTRRLPLRERLELFRRVCEGVEYAHRRLVIHRDLKARNILVTAGGVPKLLDFGIARLVTSDDGSDQTRTVLRAFTLESASPEQVRGEPMSVTSDVYALGVLLYRTVTGQHPYGGGPLTDTAFIRAICEEPPFSPSTVARSTTGLQVPEELEWVILKALRKEPERRYGSVEHFEDDIRRLLGGLPVQAAPDSRWYRTRKFVGRHRLALAAAALAGVSLLGGLGATLWQARQAELARELAERRLTTAQQLANAMVFEVNDALEHGNTGARALLLTRASEQLDALAAEAAGNAALSEALAVSYHKLGDVLGQSGSAHIGDREAGRANHHKGLALRRALVAQSPDNQDARFHLAQSLILTAFAEDEVEPSLAAGREAVEVAERLVAANSQPRRYRRVLASAFYALGSQFRAIGDNTTALPLFEKAAPLNEAVYREQPDADSRRALALVHKRLGAILMDAGAATRAMPHLEAAVALDEESLAEAPSSTARQRDLSTSNTQLGTGRRLAGDFSGAIAAFSRAVTLREGIYAADRSNAQAPRDLASALRYLGEAHADAGQTDTGIPLLERALIIGVTLRRDDNLRSSILHSLAGALERAGLRQRAAAVWRDAFDTDRTLVATQPENLAFRRGAVRSAQALARVLRQLGQASHADRARREHEACDVLAAGVDAFARLAHTTETEDARLGATLTEAAANCPGPAATRP